MTPQNILFNSTDQSLIQSSWLNCRTLLIVTDYIVTQMAAGKTFGAMIVWIINTLDRVGNDNLVWGNAAALFKNRMEISKYYSVDKASTALDQVVLQQILSRVTVDSGTVVTAKTAIDKLLCVSNGPLNDDCKDFQLNNMSKIKKMDSMSMPRRLSLATGFIF